MQKFSRLFSNAKALVCLFFILLTLVGLLTTRDYGMPFDELSEMHIIRANLQEYAIRLEGKNGKSIFSHMKFPPMSRYIERDHGISGYYLLAPFLPASVMDNIHVTSLLWSALTWCWFMLGCISLYGLMRCLGVTRSIACVAVLLLYLSPRFFAEGHYNNKDIVLLSFILFTLWMGARFLQKPGIGRGMLFSLAGAMSANTKIVGILPWGLMGFAAILLISSSRRWNRKIIITAAITFFSFVGFYALLTPALWDDPLGYLQFVFENASHFSRFGGSVIFRGANFYDVANQTPLPFYYLPYYILVSIPLYTLAFAVIGQLHTIQLCIKKKNSILQNERLLTLLVCTFAWLLPLTYAVFGRPLMYNGWRHFYFVYAGIVAMAGFGVHALWQVAQKRRVLRYGMAVLVSSCLLFTAGGLIINHPYQFAYFNPIIKRDARYTMDLDTWNVAPGGAFVELYNQKHATSPELRVGCYFNDIATGTYKLPKHIRNAVRATVERDEDYLYYNSTYAYIYWAQEPPDGYHVLFEVKSYGNTIGVMYERDNLLITD